MIGGWAIDREAFALFVQAHRTAKCGIAMAEAARASNIPVSSFSRAENRIAVSAPNFLALCRFIGADPFLFLLDPATGKRAASRETGSETPCGGEGISWDREPPPRPHQSAPPTASPGTGEAGARDRLAPSDPCSLITDHCARSAP